MKNFKNYLHILLTFASLLGFLGGWATLAHSRKPSQNANSQTQVIEPLPPLDPIQDILTANNSNNNNGLNIVIPPSTSNRINRQSRPIFRTAGS
jgi:hypothetical protein